MENRKLVVKNKKFISLFVLFGAVFLFSYIFAYSPYYTHPDLTEEIAKLFNLKNSNQDLEISQNEIQWMRQGAIDEDKPPRWINHFYDPIHKVGWQGKHFGDRTQEQGLYEGESMAPKLAITSIDWAVNQEYQSAYGRQYGNQTWQKAIKSYIDGDKKSAFIAMGHILHLMEDASVPDHTRNDTHADLYGDPGSPYEKYSKEYTNFNKLNIAENLKSKELFNFSNIQGAFEYIANYSNNNFFSEDTISNEEFGMPNLIKLKIISERIDGNIVRRYLYNQINIDKIYLSWVKEEDPFSGKKLYSTDDKSLVLPSYFSNLAPQAVLTGASVMNLFFQEVEKYRKNPELLPEIIPDSNESIVSYVKKAPRLAAVNVADKCDRITTDYKINGGIANIGKEVGCSAILSMADVADKTITNTQKIGIFAQGIISNVASIFFKSENSLSSVANIGQIVNQTEPQITNQDSGGEITPSASLPRNDSKEEIASPLVGPSTGVAINLGDLEARNDAFVVTTTKQSEIIHAPYQWPEEVIHAPYQKEAVASSQPQQTQLSFIFVAGSGSNREQESNQQIQNGGDVAGQNDSQLGGDTQVEPSADQGDVVTPQDTVNTGQGGDNSQQQIVIEDLIAPSAPVITTNNGQDFTVDRFLAQIISQEKIILEGSKSEDAESVFINGVSDGIVYPTATSWRKEVPLQEGENIFEVKAKDIAGNISDASTIKITLQFSDVKFYLTNYDVRKPNFTLYWEDKNSVAKNWELQYKLGPNFDWADLASSSQLAVNSYAFAAKYDDLTYYFRLRGSDMSGSQTDWQYLQADISSKPVVINEIAWMGTAASYTDEWIELANKTDQEIDLKGWNLKSSYGNINIKLAGKIAPNGFYLLERTNDNPIANIQADQIYTGDLNNPGGSYPYGQTLTLNDNNSNLVDQSYAAAAGENSTKKTSERISIWASGMEQKNWKTYIGVGGGAQDASGNKILGTPREKNSQADLYYLLGVNNQINSDGVILQKRGVVLGGDYAVNIASGKSLVIEPGAILKFGYYGGLHVYGSLIAKGTDSDKIIFTSINDDEYGGDTESNGQTAITNWMNIDFQENSSGEFTNSIIRYGGNVWTTSGSVFINKAIVKISNSIIENMGRDAVYFKNSDANVSGSEFRNNKSKSIIVHQSSADITNNIFDNNIGEAIFVEYPNEISWTDIYPTWPIKIKSNTFTRNEAPLRLRNFGDFDIQGNMASQNHYNGILLDIANISNGSTMTLSADMTFISINALTVQAGGTLIISPGTVMKFDGTAMSVQGTLLAVGTSDNPIVFTALTDDQYGGDANNDGSLTQPRAASWYWIKFASGGENSIMDNTIVKYAGKYSAGGPSSGGNGIYIESGAKNFVLRNSTISDSVTGMFVSSDGTSIENSTFSNNSSSALVVRAKNVTVKDVSFNNNQIAFESSLSYIANILLYNLMFGSDNVHNYYPENLITQ